MSGARLRPFKGKAGRQVAAQICSSLGQSPASPSGSHRTRGSCSQAYIRREAGHALYKHRKSTVEPVFAQIKFNRKITRFQRRGRAAVLSEWRLVAATHNLLKVHGHWIAAENG